MCERALKFVSLKIVKLQLEVLTVAVVLEQQRPVAGVDSRRRSLWLDGVRVGVGLHESHCVEFSVTWWLHLPSCKARNFSGRRENFTGLACALLAHSAK